MTLEQTVALAILLQGNGGIMTKSPRYILEKLEQVTAEKDPAGPLDHPNRIIYEAYILHWKI